MISVMSPQAAKLPLLKTEIERTTLLVPPPIVDQVFVAAVQRAMWGVDIGPEVWK